MRIAQLCQSYPPMISGASFTVAQLAKGFAAKGHDTLVIAASDRRRGYTTQWDCLTETRLPSWYNPARVNQRFLFCPYGQIKNHLQRFKPDLLHVHEPLGLGLCGLRIARKMNIPVILTLHQLPWFAGSYAPSWWGINQGIESLFWRYGRWLLGQFQATIVPTNTISTIIEKQIHMQTQVIPCGAELSRFTRKICGSELSRLRKKYGLAPDRPTILHVGRLDTDKRVDRVIRAAAPVISRMDAQLLVVGDGRQRKNLVTLSQQLGIHDRCHFPGFVDPEEDLPGLYRLANLFVTASEIETFGIVILEAMASACPIVAVNATCLPELVQEGQNGFLVGGDDIAAMAQKMIWLIQDSQKAIKMGLCGQRLSQEYGEEQMLLAHLHLYKSWQQAPQKHLMANRKRQVSAVTLSEPQLK